MIGKPYRFRYRFYPVGQGLFSSGFIEEESSKSSRFLWVYDCGTSSSQQLVDYGISRLRARAGRRKRLDFVTISHFDQDHISGICRLVDTFRIGILLLPYMPLAQRLILAFEEGVRPSDPLCRFFIDPVDYLSSREGPGIENILFVPPSGEGVALIAETRSPEPHGDKETGVDFDHDGQPDNEELLRPAQTSPNTRVSVLRKGATINVRGLWEFVPYNDDPERTIPNQFRKKVAIERNVLLNSSTGERSDALRRLKTIYDTEFGKSALKRNIISLFLYAGPIYKYWTATRLLSFKRFPKLVKYQYDLFDFMGWQMNRCSILYTGDGYLDTRMRLQRLVRYLNKIRVQRTGIFHVMHHGAKGNWHKGVAAAISPSFSVFSSDPGRKGLLHPHRAVVRDFRGYGPVQVDKSRSFSIWGRLQ